MKSDLPIVSAGTVKCYQAKYCQKQYDRQKAVIRLSNSVLQAISPSALFMIDYGSACTNSLNTLPRTS